MSGGTAATVGLEPGDASLRHDARFRAFWVASTVSQLGDRVSELALPLLAVTLLGASTAEVGVLTAAIWAPFAVALFVGVWVDRVRRKRRVLVAADLGQAGVLLSVPLAWWGGWLSLGQVVLVAFAMGVANVFSATAQAPVFVSLVSRRAFAVANGRLATVRSGSFLVGPPLGGALVSALTAPVAVVVDAVSFVVSALLVGRIPLVERPTRDVQDAGRLWGSALDGLRFVVRHRFLRASLGCATTINFFSFGGSALLLVFASRELGLSAAQIGLALGAGAVGGVLAAVVAARVGERVGVGRTIVLGAVLFAGSFLVLPLAGGSPWTSLVVIGLAELLSGIGVMLFDVNLNSVQASVTPDVTRSRASGAFSTINYGMRPLGALAGGGLGTWVGIRPTLVVVGVGAAFSVLWLLWSPIARVRHMGDLDAVDPMTGLGSVNDR